MFLALHNRWIRVALVAAFWGFVGFVLSLELYFNSRARLSPQETINFWELAVPQFARAAMWVSLAPLILKLREKVPLNRGRWAGGVTFHLLLSFTVMAVYYLGRIQSYFLFWPEKAAGDEFWAYAAKGFYGATSSTWLTIGACWRLATASIFTRNTKARSCAARSWKRD